MTSTTFPDVETGSGGTHPIPEPSAILETRAFPHGKEARGWASRLVDDAPDATFAELGRRAAAGLGLSALYGLAIGARQGGRALLQHTAGVPLGLLLVGIVGAPSMFVFLSICRTSIDAKALASTTARGIGSAGVLLAGLAPAAALFVVSSETPGAARYAVLFGLILGGGVALGRTVWEVLQVAFRGRWGSAFGGACVAGAFAAFAVSLAIRIWSAFLPILHVAHAAGGAS